MDIHAVLNKIRPGSAYQYGGPCVDGYDETLLVWLDGGTSKPTVQEINDGWALVQADMAAEAENEALSEAAAAYINVLDIIEIIENANGALNVPDLCDVVAELAYVVGQLARAAGFTPTTEEE